MSLCDALPVVAMIECELILTFSTKSSCCDCERFFTASLRSSYVYQISHTKLNRRRENNITFLTRARECFMSRQSELVFPSRFHFTLSLALCDVVLWGKTDFHSLTAGSACATLNISQSCLSRQKQVWMDSLIIIRLCKLSWDEVLRLFYDLSFLVHSTSLVIVESFFLLQQSINSFLPAFFQRI